MFNGTSNQVFADWFLELLLNWHNTVDPVDTSEIIRNEAAYNFQGNANPFVDHPEYANMIWNPSSDAIPPSTPQNVVTDNVTSNSIHIEWSASTDNIGVVAYEVYIDNTFLTETSSINHTAFNLENSTQYCFKIKAKDAAGNLSNFSNEVCTTTLQSGGDSGECINESLDNWQSGSGRYSNRVWTGYQGGEWFASDARTDQYINGNAITIRNGILEAPQSTNGIANFSVVTKRVFSGSSGTFDLYVNNNFIDTVAYDSAIQTVTISDINIEGNISINLKNNSDSGNRVAFDDISWSCYEPLNIADTVNNIKIFPNPIRNSRLFISGAQNSRIQIFDFNGALVMDTLSKQSNTVINTLGFSKGIYILKIIHLQNIKTIQLSIE